MRFTAVTVASLAGAAFSRPLALNTTATDLVKDLEGFTKPAVQTRQLSGLGDQIANLSSSKLTAREEKEDALSAALSSIAKSISARQLDVLEDAAGIPFMHASNDKRQVDEVESIVDEALAPVASGSTGSIKGRDHVVADVVKRQTELLDELTRKLPTRQTELVEELTKELSLPTKRDNSELLDELTELASLPKRQDAGAVEDLVNSLSSSSPSLPTKRQTEIVSDLTKTLSLPGKRQTEMVEELTKTLSLPTKRQTEILSELTDKLPLPTKRQTEILEELTKELPTRQTEIISDLTKELPTRQLDDVKSVEETL